MGSAATLSTLFLSTLLVGASAQQEIPNLNATAQRWPFSGAWEGNDGAWGTFFMHVGTPSQIVRVLPATNWQETWVVDAEACRNIAAEQCYDLRGQTFNVNSSSTWNDQGLFNTDLAKDLGYNAIGNYGLERLGITNVDSGITFNDQVVVAVDSKEWFLGVFGLGTQPTNFTDFNNPQPSFLTTMYNQGLIPSLSWGYQAGAVYRGKTASASLVFGGYDDSLYIDNDMIFTQANEYTNPFLVALSSLTVSGVYRNGQQGTAELLDPDWRRTTESQLISIDSATSYIWLPNDTCRIFESALNLTWNEEVNLYILTDDAHTQLLDLNPTFVFTISDNAQNQTALEIELPYNAFSLEAIGPEILGAEGKAWYFPLKRLPDNANPRLGRVFMQEVYLFAEYHFGTFRVFQADWSNRPQNIVTHLPVRLVASGKKDSSTPIGAIVGGVVGGVAVIGVIAGVWFLRRRRQQKVIAGGDLPSDDKKESNLPPVPEVDGSTTMPNELGGEGVAGAWAKKSGWHDQSGQGASDQNTAAVGEVHEAPASEKQWNEADGTPVLRPHGEKFQHRRPENAGAKFYAELEGGDVIAPMSGASTASPMSAAAATPAQELPTGETRRQGS
ncbi:uncharacterized protein DFL_003804 [Arthrobotrys flagrans]|uniref:Peptidase A1 domain-containing protein n=1 Tax=Arthrobotrys flagrans TaxID=97331 RepID=A0A437A2V7_ARTFL|nr:hypothetical protein DFL_003804 [Arthrobotrys flagrans]